MSAKKKSQKSVSEGPPKFWDNQRNQLISAVVGGVVVGLTLASATQLAPYVYQVFVTRKQNAVEVVKIDQEISTRLLHFFRSLKRGAPTLFKQQRLFLNEADPTDNTAWMYSELKEQALTDLIFRLIRLEPNHSKVAELQTALESVIAVETRFQEALDRTNDVYVGTMPGTDDKTVTNADGNIDRYTRPVGFITQIGPSSSAALMLIAPREIDNLNLPRWNRPFSEN